MPIRKRFTRRSARRRLRRRARPIRRKTMTMYKKPFLSNQIYRFKRYTSTLTNFTIATSVGGTAVYTASSGLLNFTTPAAAGFQYVAFSFSHILNDITGVLDFTALYDQYRLLGVSFKLFPFANDPATATGGAVAGLGCLVHHVLDFDDAVNPAASAAGIQLLQESGYYRCTNMANSKYIKRYYKPRYLGMVSSNAGTVASVIGQRKQWLDLASPDIPHFGSKIIFEVLSNTAVAVSVQFRIEMCYYFKVLGTR